MGVGRKMETINLAPAANSEKGSAGGKVHPFGCCGVFLYHVVFYKKVKNKWELLRFPGRKEYQVQSVKWVQRGRGLSESPEKGKNTWATGGEVKGGECFPAAIMKTEWGVAR